MAQERNKTPITSAFTLMSGDGGTVDVSLSGSGSYIPASKASGAGDAPSDGRVESAVSVGMDGLPSLSESGEAGTAAAPKPPVRIGHYRITRLIGAGGMGAVYEAEQDNPRRTVALKVMRGAIASPQASRRFEYESQLLARLRHPGIAQVYEAGTHTEESTAAAFPYFAMELIPGAKSLTEYADAASLNLQQRIALFIQICDAVQHGHQRGIIHRDLKPANILVDSSGSPKIIDFGVARANADDDVGAPGAETQTRAGQLVGTLQYMSPEQCGGTRSGAVPGTTAGISSSTPERSASGAHSKANLVDVASLGAESGEKSRGGGSVVAVASKSARLGLDIDVRTDVYSLGVILYELLAGKLPHALEGTSLFAAVMIIRDDAPVKPSVYRKELRGDLETILLKSLEKDRSRRYSSAADVAADLGRFLRHEPILARNIGVMGRLSRWVRRNRAVATVGAVSLAVLVVTSVVLVTRILRESARANAALVQAEQNLKAAKDNFSLIKTFFGSMRPNDQQRGLVDVEQLMDNAAKQLVDKPPALPATEADFREIIAGGYQGLGRYSKSLDHQRRVVAFRLSLNNVEDLGLADSLHQLAAAHWWSGEFDAAAPLYERSLTIRRTILGKEHADVAMSLTHLAACKLKQGHTDDATKYYVEALEMRRRLQGNQSADVAASLNNLAKCEAVAGRLREAELHFTEALAMIRTIRGPDDLTTATAQSNLGLFLIEAGKPTDAAVMLSAALATRLAKFNSGHHFVALARLGLARALFAQARGEHLWRSESVVPAAAVEALSEARVAFGLLQDTVGNQHPDVIDAAGHIGLMAALACQPKEATDLLLFARDVTLKNQSATRRDRNETELRFAIALALTPPSAGSSEARDELALLVQTLDGGHASQSLRTLAASVVAEAGNP